MLFVQTGNHHLFIIAQPWIILLGKRKRHFPFFGTRFENATFYNTAEQKLYHHAAEEMKDLVFETPAGWRISGKRPVDFSLELVPTPLARRSTALGMVRFQYHTLTLLSGRIGSEPLSTGHGFSEQGRLLISTSKKLQVPFRYALWLAADGRGGRVEWGADSRHTIFFLRFLNDQFQWGDPVAAAPGETLARTTIPLNGWQLHREIIQTPHGTPAGYGLREWFE